MKLSLLTIFICFLTAFAGAAETIPPKPARFVTDQAGVLSRATVAKLNQQLSDFDHTTSNQILVVIYPKMQSDSSIDDYTLRIANQWKAGQKKLDNGAILFVFVQDHKLFIQVGYGLEGALPDALCKRIIDEQITPRFKQKDFDGGITAGVQAMMEATKGEYKGTGSSPDTDMASHQELGQEIWIGVFLLIFICTIISRIRRYSVYGPSGMRGGWFVGPMIGSGGGFGGGGGGGGFSSGGGGFGGGGAGGSW